MSEFLSVLLPLIPAFSAGFALGSLFFATLWLTVRRLPTAQNPAQLFLTSFLARMATVLVGLYYVMDGHWERMLAATVGFFFARTFLVRRIQPKPFTAVSEE